MEWFQRGLEGIGHLGLWCVVFNRIHATALPRGPRKISEKFIILIVVIPLVVVATNLVFPARLGFDPASGESYAGELASMLGSFGVYYFNVCALLGFFFIGSWVVRKWRSKSPASVIQSRSQSVNLAKQIDTPLLRGWLSRWLGRLPLNEVLQLTTEELTIALDVAPELDGLKICQLSDLHFTGQIAREFFEDIVRRANAFEPDIIVVTGDLVDVSECLPWLDSTLGELRSKLGCFYVLGNHDRRIQDEDDYRQRIEHLGLLRAAGVWRSVCFNGIDIKITGNELPWYPGAEGLPELPATEAVGLKILLSHSPDQIGWAAAHGFDLMFAGHTHGGQIALPIIGPLIAPSKYGVLYASGTFQIGKTLMHVSRGISGDEPVRFCSPPELGFFTIRSQRRLA